MIEASSDKEWLKLKRLFSHVSLKDDIVLASAQERSNCLFESLQMLSSCMYANKGQFSVAHQRKNFVIKL